MPACSVCKSGSGYVCGKCGARHCTVTTKCGFHKYTGNRCGACGASAVKSG